MSTFIESDEWKKTELEEEIRVEKKYKILKSVTLEETSEQLSKKSKDLFEELFETSNDI